MHLVCYKSIRIELYPYGYYSFSYGVNIKISFEFLHTENGSLWKYDNHRQLNIIHAFA